MTAIPNLKELTEEQKDELIIALIRRLNEFEARLEKDSHNSSKPPSTDGFKRKPKSLRKTGGRVGGQPGHPGKTLKQVAHPDQSELHAPPQRCDACGALLDISQATLLPEVRQVFELPALRMMVSAHQVQSVRCRCGKIHCGQFPPEVSQSVQYGPRAQAVAVYLTQYQQLPVQRTAQLLGELFRLPLSAASVQRSIERAAQLLAPVRDTIAQALRQAPVVHFDDTSMHVGCRQQYWLHSASTATLSWYGAHRQRGRPALDSLGILPHFNGVAVHDGWRPYADYGCTHALCNAHHLRELIYVDESTGQPWARAMIDLLRQAHDEVERDRARGRTTMRSERRSWYRRRAARLVKQGLQCNPRQERGQSKQTLGRLKQSFAYNLLARLQRYADQVWRFIADYRVPFDNNQAERDLRMPKLKQKISGCWRTANGMHAYCIIRSYLSTLHKQGRSLIEALTASFGGQVPCPLGS